MVAYQTIKMFFATLVLLCIGATVVKASPDECLRSANKYRALHMNTGPLQWDSTLAAKAKAYAQVLLNNALRYGSANLVHDPMNKRDPKMGENLWYEDSWKTGDDAYYCKKADKDWYDEIKDYSYATARSTGGPVGHFTQMVWVDTKRVGYGVAVGKSPTFNGNKIAFVVAKYQEPGNFNWIGQRLKDYTRNVQPLTGTLTSSAIKGGSSGNDGGSSKSKGGGETCEDNATRCLGWARRGECTANSGWMKKNCCKSCASVSSKAAKAGRAAKAGCKDDHADCSGWAGRGECKRNSGWMMKNCKLSCGACSGKIFPRMFNR